MTEFPLAYHITFGTYGARLHGSDRPHVDKDHNEFGAPLAAANPYREDEARARMKFDAVSMNREQCQEIEAAIHDVARRYNWTIHSIASKPDHTHVVITADREGEQLRDALKAVASKWLNKKFGARPWWAEGGSAKYIWAEDYLAAATDYVFRQRDF